MKILIANLKPICYKILSGTSEDYELDLGNISSDTNLEQELIFELAQDANLNLKITGFGEIFINLCLKIEFTGVNSRAKLISALLLNKNSLVKFKILQNHIVPDCESWVQVRTVLDDCAQFNYDGKIFISKNAHNTVAHQENKNIALNKDVYVRSIPSIQVLNSEVTCGHGSATGELDRDQLIYLCSRGLPPEIAKTVLIESFLGINFLG